jgi:uncharacterized lipoprotein NlpE involved in copper resistance
MKIRHIAPVILVALLGCNQNDSPKGGTIVLAKVAKVAKPKASAAAAASAVPQGTFEGEIELSLEMKSTAKQPTLMHAAVKGSKVRFDAPAEAMGAMAGKAYQIIAIDEGKMRTVVDAQKMVVEMDIAKFGEQMKAMTGGKAEPANAPPPKITKTSKTDTVVGRSCEEWEVINLDKEKMTICVAKGGGWPQFPVALMPGGESWSKEVVDGDHFPLRIVLNSADGAEKMRMQITKMDKKPIDDAVFKIPEGYRVMDMAAMMGAMGAMAGAGGMGGAMVAPVGSASGRPQLKLPPNVEKMIEEAKAKAAASKK